MLLSFYSVHTQITEKKKKKNVLDLNSIAPWKKGKKKERKTPQINQINGGTAASWLHIGPIWVADNGSLSRMASLSNCKAPH